ncbi:hypothetical protein BTUL_0003g01230 [Botrytis tulipae]|uniref:Uncharacterized protein n=1 Tax=Botrytis tulipae TaxID=87230 RepID=A0A4Z1F813_9HELO|nr:hypothetical protein BTUL_0003g01230 [Botrytis tulipae]
METRARYQKEDILVIEGGVLVACLENGQNVLGPGILSKKVELSRGMQNLTPRLFHKPPELRREIKVKGSGACMTSKFNPLDKNAEYTGQPPVFLPRPDPIQIIPKL